MKKRIGKINTDAIVFSNTDKNAEELLELFLQEKQAFNLSSETISLYRYHCKASRKPFPKQNCHHA
ncbi:MAG: hypothetical protein Q4D59_09825 [Erysipelotrichaceae bacterium]|nr:hypothetical protein [Erysipelotrichaceae bacterium]